MLFLSEVAQMKREISSTCTSAPQLTAWSQTFFRTIKSHELLSTTILQFKREY